MNWTETTIGAGAVFAGGLLALKNAVITGADFAAPAISGSVELLSQTMAAPPMVEIAGIAMARGEFFLMLIITAACSAVAAGMRFRDWRSALVNWVLGALFGWLWALGLAVTPAVPDAALFALAPSLSLIAARLARHFIADDAAIDALIGGIFRRK